MQLPEWRGQPKGEGSGPPRDGNFHAPTAKGRYKNGCQGKPFLDSDWASNVCDRLAQGHLVDFASGHRAKTISKLPLNRQELGIL
uniref:Bm11835 n=1 Tax=Brugia malayi TaxID=6279 RepID=A0A1I9G9S7_BRUMA|nr:Bm11835 [Brugia malayi]